MGSKKRSMGMHEPDPNPRHPERPSSGSSIGNEHHFGSLKILVVENLPDVVDSIVLWMTARWRDSVLIVTGSGRDAIQIAQTAAPDIVLLGLALADLYGLQVLREIRSFSSMPVIMLSPSYEETTRLRSFGIGATDYLVVSPFSPVELLGSINAALAHLGGSRRPHTQSLVINLARNNIFRTGVESSLTMAESKVLTALLRNHGQTISYAQLIQEGWREEAVTHSTLTLCIQQLRMKLGDDLEEPRLIHLQRNAGYSLNLFG